MWSYFGLSFLIEMWSYFELSFLTEMWSYFELSFLIEMWSYFELSFLIEMNLVKLRVIILELTIKMAVGDINKTIGYKECK
jgi:hypothetical protein